MQKLVTRAAALAAALVAFAPGAGAQQGALAPQCSPNGDPLRLAAQDACQKAVDIFNLVAPQLGTAVAGGNAVLGGTGTLGGFPHFTVGLRVNGLQGTIPQPQNVQLAIDGARRSDLGAKEQWAALPAAEAAVGIFKGIPVGLTNVGGIDALVSAFYVPSASEEDFTLDGGALKLGYGARLGVIQETAVLPGVSVSYLRRDLPTLSAAARVGVNDSVLVRSLDVQTSAWRVVAGKRILWFAISAGAGQDTYESSARVGAFVAPRTGFPGASVDIGSVSQKVTRTNYFADLSLALPVLSIVGEVGRAEGGDIPASYNAFGDASPGDAYTYGSVGIRVAF